MAEHKGVDFPQNPHEQLLGAIKAVFSSWMNHRAIVYRELHNIPADWGTAVNVQAMVFGNMDDNSATGVAFSRNPSTGARELYGEFLINAQGEDVVAGMRTPQPISEEARGMREIPTRRRWRRRCRLSSPSSRPMRKSWKRITATCRTWSSPSSAASYGCCKRATASAPRRPR